MFCKITYVSHCKYYNVNVYKDEFDLEFSYQPIGGGHWGNLTNSRPKTDDSLISTKMLTFDVEMWGARGNYWANVTIIPCYSM